jgi:ribosomal-protein-alanine N-acetyltransferase
MVPPMSELEAIKNYRPISERLATGGQPSAEQIELIARAGFQTLMNLALPTSEGALLDESRVAMRHGLEYLHFPLDFEEPELATALEFLRALRGRAKKPVFVHCVMNYRASALVYAHRVAVLGEDVVKARRSLLSVWEPSEVWLRLMADAARLSLKPVRLETERLVLREVELDDAAEMQLYAGDPEVCRFMIWGPNTAEQTRAFCASQLDVQRARDRRDFELAVIEKASGELVGGVGLRVRNTVQREGDVGYVLRRDRWGRGLVPEAVTAALRFGFGVLGLHRIWATADARNVQSTRVMEKVGMRREGLMVRNLYLKGAFRDTVLYALLEDEFWKAAARKL